MKYFIVIFSLFTLSACGYSPDTMQDNYKRMSQDYAKELKQMADFSQDEKQRIEQFTEQLQQWHQQNRLPVYIHVLSDLVNQLEQNPNASANSVLRLVQLINGYPHYHEATSTNLQLALLAKQSTDQQIQQISHTLLNDAKSVEEQLKGKSKQQMNRQMVKSTNAIFSYFDIDLERKQLDIIERHSKGFHQQNDLVVNANNEWTNQLITLLKNRKQAGFEQRFISHMKKDNNYVRMMAIAPQETQENTNKVVVMLQELFVSFSGQQRQKMIEQLHSVNNALLQIN